MEFDVVLLSRLQFAFTIMVHYLFPPLSIGLGVLLVIFEAIWLKTGDPDWHRLTKFWVKLFAVTFAVGVATGIVMEFEFGTNWAVYSRFVGDVFGSALAAEGIFAFFLESGFLAVLVFGWDRVGKKMHFFSTLMVCLGSIFSSDLDRGGQQLAADARRPSHRGCGRGERAEIVDFWALVFNPSTMDRLVHVWIGALLTGTFFVMSISAYYLLSNRHVVFAKRSFTVALILGTIAAIAAPISGDSSARLVAREQPSKLAAMEGLYKTTEGGTPITVFGIPDDEAQELKYALQIPAGLSLLTYRDTTTPVVGLDRFRPEDRPPVLIPFVSFHLMVGIGIAADRDDDRGPVSAVARPPVRAALAPLGFRVCDRSGLPGQPGRLGDRGSGPSAVDRAGRVRAGDGGEGESGGIREVSRDGLHHAGQRTSYAGCRQRGDLGGDGRGVARNVRLDLPVAGSGVGICAQHEDPCRARKKSMGTSPARGRKRGSSQWRPTRRTRPDRRLPMHAAGRRVKTKRRREKTECTRGNRPVSYDWLCLIWFGLLGVLLAGYAILDGFDLGVGMLHPLAKTDKERRIFMNSIGPLWDGNEVWLVTFGGALFAAFPNAYASAFSGFYIAFHLLLLALILRAVSMEFRSKRTGAWWRRFWDLCFLLGSTIAPLLYGVAIGNSLRGIPLKENQDYAGSFFDLLNPYSLGVGIMALSLFVMHGNIYLYLKTEGDLQKKLHDWIWRHFFLFLAIYLVMTAWTMIEVPTRAGQLQAFPVRVGDCGADCAGDRQHPPGDLPQPAAVRVYLVVVHDRRPRVPGGNGALPQSGDFVHRSGDAKRHYLPGRIVDEDPPDHADHRRDRDAVCIVLHHRHLLGVPGQGQAGLAQLLISGSVAKKTGLLLYQLVSLPPDPGSCRWNNAFVTRVAKPVHDGGDWWNSGPSRQHDEMYDETQLDSPDACLDMPVSLRRDRWSQRKIALLPVRLANCFRRSPTASITPRGDS